MSTLKFSPAVAFGLWYGFFLVTHAHMQMIWPYPIRSAYDPAVPVSEKDYSMTSPLLPDGSNFPCKNYQLDNDSYVDKAVYVPGQTYNLTLGGSATHDGGSCQISLSYDNGLTFKVIESIIGGCPLTPSYNFTIPTFAPASDTVLLSWSWFNIVGNREMYHNCARVAITNTVTQRYQRVMHKRQTSMDSLPDMFVCNVNNGCTTVEDHEVVFPDPGSNVVYGEDAITPDPGAGFVESGNTVVSSVPSTSAAPVVASTSSPAVTASSTTSLVTTSVPSSFTSSYSGISTTTATSFMTSTYVVSTTAISSTVSPDDDENNDSGASSTSSMVVLAPVAPTVSTTSMSAASASPSSSAEDGGYGGNGGYGGDDQSSSTDGMYGASSSTSSASPATISSSNTDQPNPISTTYLTFTQISPANSASSGFITSTITSATLVTAAAASSPSSSSSSTNSFSAAPTAGFSITNVSTEPCTPGEVTCNSLTTWSQCVSTDAYGDTGYTYMGVVAAGTQCVNGQFEQENSGTCNPSGGIVCNGSNAFYMCVNGGLINMGPLAAGTVCQNNVIVAAY